MPKLKPVSPLDPFAIPRFMAMCLRWWVKKVGWKWILTGWSISTVAIIVYTLHGG